MIRLFTAPTPNSHKVSIVLEELGLPYEVVAIDLAKKQQAEDWFLAMNPNGRIPVIADLDAGGHVVFESGAIMVYLAEKAGRLIPSDPRQRSIVMQWLMFQMSGIGPMMGQAATFSRYFPKQIPEAIARYQHESRRLYEVLDRHLHGREYLADAYSIADIASYCWLRYAEWIGTSLEGLHDVQQWMERIGRREAVRRGILVPPPYTDEERARQGTAIATT